MKLLKKLLPLAGLASTAAIVAPLVASCSGGMVSTSSFDYKPDEKHAKETFDMKQEGAKAKIEKAMDDYFSKPMRFAQDYCYYTAQVAKEDKADLIKEGNTDVNVSFFIKVNNISVKEKKTITYESDDITGYIIDASVSATLKFSYTKKLEEKEKETIKSIKITEEIKTDLSIKNGFAYLYYTQVESGETTKNIPTVRFGVADLASNDWEESSNSTVTDITEQTGIDGKTIKNSETVNATETKAKKAGDTADFAKIEDLFEYVGSYYFSDVEVKLA